MVGKTAEAGIVPASIAIFQHNHDEGMLNYPNIVSLTHDVIVITTKSDLWLNSIMRESNQDLPPASVALQRLFKESSRGHHQLAFPEGAKSLKVMVDKLCLPPEDMEQGFELKGGELVRIYSTHWLRFGIAVDEWAGPFSFQYRSAIKVVDCKLKDVPEKTKLALDQLPKTILRMIFAYLPVDEVLHNIPAVCTKFLLAARDKMAFHQWELAGGSPTPREAAFSQAWTAGPVCHLVLTNLPMTTVKEWHSASRFLGHDLHENKKSIKSIECHLDATSSSEEDPQFARIKENAIFRFMHLLGDFPAVECLKISGLPFLPLNVPVLCKFFRLQRLWLEFHGNLLYGLDALVGPLVKSLKSVVLVFSDGDQLQMTPEADRFALSGILPKESDEDDEAPKKSCGLEELFAAFAPTDDEDKQRVLLLTGKASEWKNLEATLSPLKKLDALSLTIIDGNLDLASMKALISSIPSSVKVLKLLAEGFDDVMCLAVSRQCKLLETFVCLGREVTDAGGVIALIEGCEKLEKLFLLVRREDGSLVPKRDIIPERFGGPAVRLFENEMRRTFD